ncbi:hypothetical protein [uncultured Sphingomonas sp.]|uniref:hypothetical protein n=1 Tax=uncultured Sphingomonas sp. TaxID=158754 RepID=UPI0025DE4EE8|nr:hypothetical protein [uncultured Sphingomonas sp.]
MSEEANQAAAKTAAPKKVEMQRSVHEIITGPKPENVIEPGTLMTDDVTKKHTLDAKSIKALTASGALETVEVLKG